MVKNTGQARKLDKMGRLVFPIRLREDFGLKIGEVYDFYTITDEQGNVYLGIRSPYKAEQLESVGKLL